MKKIVSILLLVLIVLSALSVVYVSADSSTSTDNTKLSSYYSTNPSGNCGEYASIKIDGDLSDWKSSMLIAQGTANDDPRVYMGSSMHENPIDSYALYSAWDDNNLYIMWEMKNVQDIVAPNDDFPLSQGLLYQTTNLPIFIALNTGKRTAGEGLMESGSTVWDSGITYQSGLDTMICVSTNGCNGPYVYKTNTSGKLVSTDQKDSNIKLNWGNNQSVSTSCYGIYGGYGKSHNRIPGDITSEDSDWVDYYSSSYKHNKKLDFFYEVSIPFKSIDIDKNYLESNGISIMQVMTFGTSGMNSLPYDLSMSDNANKPYSKDSSSTMEKEDEDDIKASFAQIGKCEIKPTEEPTIPTEPSTSPTQPGKTYKYGDVDLNGTVEIIDATYIQKNIAKIIEFNYIQEIVADVNKSGKADIISASTIQKKIANIITKFPAGDEVVIN